MIQRTSLIAIAIMAQFGLAAQSTLDYIQADSITYNSYMASDWEGVIHHGKKALNSDIDYYYLRMRMGIAYFNEGKYTKAVKQFQRALDFNFDDKNAQLYLYDTYRILGMNAEAAKLTCSFSEKMKEDLSIDNPLIRYAEAGGGYVFSNNFDDNTKITHGTSDTLSGFNVLIGDKSVMYATAIFNFSNSISYQFGINNIEVKKRTIFQINDADIMFDSIVQYDWGYQNYYTLKNNFSIAYSDYTIRQNEIYQSVNMQFSRGLSLNLFGNIVMVKSQNSFLKNDTAKISYIDYQIINEEPVMFEFNNISYKLVDYDSSFVDYLVGFNLSKRFSANLIGMMGTYSSLNGLSQYQLRLNSFYYLLPSGTLFGSTNVIWFNQQSNMLNDENRFIFTQEIGGRLLPDIWLTGGITIGNLNNTNLANGYIVYNQVDKTKYKAALSFKWFINDNLKFNIYYNYVTYESTFIQYSEDNNAEGITQYYNTNNIIGGLSWSF